MNYIAENNENKKTADLFLYFVANIRYIFLISAISLIISVLFYIFFSTEKYTATSIVQKTIYSPESQSSSSPLSSLAALGGISIDNADAEKVIVKKIQTRNFFEDLINNNISYPQKIYAANSYDFNLNQINYKNDLYDKSKEKWKKNINNQTIHEEFLKSLSIKYNLDDNLIYISYEHVSPLFASEII